MPILAMHLISLNIFCTTVHRYPIFSMRYSVMCKVYTGYCGTREIEHGLCACTVDNPLAKARGLSLRTGAQTMLYLSLISKTAHYNILITQLHKEIGSERKLIAYIAPVLHLIGNSVSGERYRTTMVLMFSVVSIFVSPNKHQQQYFHEWRSDE